MPSDYRCDSCALEFSVGRYHYHGVHDGYLGRTLLICRACGTQHAVEHAMRDRGPATFPLVRLTATVIPDSARSLTARWLRRTLKLSYDEALRRVRDLPCTLSESESAWRAEVMRKELEPLGVAFVCEQVGEVPNSNFGPPVADRLLCGKGPRFASEKEKLLAPPKALLERHERPACCHCGAGPSNLAEELSSGERCPSCEADTLKAIAHWIT